MRTLIFDIHGPYAHFRKPYSPASPVTYTFPPPTTILGIIGAICGFQKPDYHEQIGWDKVRLAVGVLAPPKKFRAAINLVNTKDNKFFRLVGENPRSQIPYEFLKDPKYRLYVAEASDLTMGLLADFLVEGKSVYTPALGLAQCIADISFVGDMASESLPEAAYNISSVVPVDLAKHIKHKPGMKYVRYRVPDRMDDDRVVHKYTEVVVNEAANGISAVTANAFKVGNENIIFF